MILDLTHTLKSKMTSYQRTIELVLNKGIQLKNKKPHTVFTTNCLFLPIWNIPAGFPNGFEN